METLMTQNAPEQTPPAPAAPAPTPPVPTPPPAAVKQPPWGDKPENFDADTAWKMIQNLRNEKGVSAPEAALQARLDAMVADQQKQRDALALALGVKPEETSDADKLAAQIQGLQGQILASEKRALAVEFKVPEAMLTATDATELRTQATSLAEFAQAAHYAATTAAPTPPPPAFQANPGQGQGNAPLTPEAQAAAEYEAYYPSPKPR